MNIYLLGLHFPEDVPYKVIYYNLYYVVTIYIVHSFEWHRLSNQNDYWCDANETVQYNLKIKAIDKFSHIINNLIKTFKHIHICLL